MKEIKEAAQTQLTGEGKADEKRLTPQRSLVISTKLQTCRIERLCQHCPGMMRFTGRQGANLYQHRCDNCNDIEYFRKQYPRIEYRDAGEYYQIVEIEP